MTVETATKIVLSLKGRAEQLMIERAIGRMYDMDPKAQAPAWVQVMIREVQAGRPFPAPLRTPND